MRVLYVCKAVDPASPTLATQVRWIRALAAQPGIEHIQVLTARHRPVELPANVDVASFEARGWPGRIFRFYCGLLTTRGWRADLMFVAQGGPYPALLLPVKLATRAMLVHWKAQPYMSPRMRFYARWCDDLVFTATPSSLPLQSDKLRVVGHGIDTELFRPTLSGEAEARRADLVFVGRISPIKRLDLVLRAVARAAEMRAEETGVNEMSGEPLSLDVIGPVQPGDEDYRRRLEFLVAELGLSQAVRFLAPVDHGEVPELLRAYGAFVNFSQTAFDKAAGEAMSCGLPVITTNPAAIEMLPPELRPQLSAGEEDLDSQASLLQRVASWDDEARQAVGRRLRETIVAGHSLDRFFGKILSEIEAQSGICVSSSRAAG